jgi:hypothetical protein
VTVEDRLRATTEAVTEAMRPVRPLDLPPALAEDHVSARPRRVRAPRRWPGWLIPLAAAMAVIAVAATLVTVRSLSAAGPGSRPAPASTSTSANGIPKYYVSLKDAGTSPKGAVERNAFLADTSTGKQLATFKPPSDALFTNAAGSSDGRTFVLEAAAGPGFGPSGNVKLVTEGGTDLWYVLRVTPGAAQPFTLTRIRIAATFSGTDTLGAAVSPDDRTLAILSLTGEPLGKVTTSRAKSMLLLRTYSIATGQLLRTWSAPVTAWIGPPADLTWLDDDRTVAFVAHTNATREYIRTLNTTRPGTSLVAGSRPVFSLPEACSSPLLASDGKSVICGTGTFLPNSKPACNKGGIELAAYSVATGKLERVLYRYSGNCRWGSALMVWAKSGTVAIAAIVVTKSVAPYPQVSKLAAASAGKSTWLPVTTWNGFGTIAF